MNLFSSTSTGSNNTNHDKLKEGNTGTHNESTKSDIGQLYIEETKTTT